MKSRIRESYNKHCKEYHQKMQDPKTSFWNRYVEWPALRSLLKPVVKNKKIADIGCGSGIHTRKIIALGGKVKGIDLSEAMIKTARQENPKIEFHVGSVEKTPFQNNEFDVAVSGLVAHYIKNLKPFFKEAHRILKRGGLFVFSMHHPSSEVFKKITIARKKEKLFGDYFHNQSYEWNMLGGMDLISYHHTFENIINSLNDCGFTTERIIEARACKGSRTHDPGSYDKSHKHPFFLIVKARKL
ncbi:class I SAM-dependent methyltransferase [Candidatus Woesearchaeota archaeon]|nr:class I SAM-dependent methyltransferase [Candidatus Woesearchaeota archaeon]